MLYRLFKAHLVAASSVTCFFCTGEQRVWIWTVCSQALLCRALPNCCVMHKKRMMMMMMMWWAFHKSCCFFYILYRSPILLIKEKQISFSPEWVKTEWKPGKVLDWLKQGEDTLRVTSSWGREWARCPRKTGRHCEHNIWGRFDFSAWRRWEHGVERVLDTSDFPLLFPELCWRWRQLQPGTSYEGKNLLLNFWVRTKIPRGNWVY